MVRSLLLFCIAILSAGCSGPGGLFPPSPPEPSAINTARNDFNLVWVQLGETEADRAREFTLFGYKRAREACGSFFKQVRELQGKTQFAKNTIVAAASAAGVIAGLSGATATAMTALFAGTGLLPATIDDFGKMFLYASVVDELEPLIYSGMSDLEEKKKAPATVTSKEEAIFAVRQYAELCTISFMSYAVKTALNSTEAVSDPPSKPKEGSQGIPLPVGAAPSAASPSTLSGSRGVGREVGRFGSTGLFVRQ